MNKVMQSVLAVAFLSAGVGGAAAETIKWDLANEYGDRSIHAEGDKLFAELVKQKTNGAIEITLHFGASLGIRSKDQLDAVANGAVPLADTFTGPLAGVDPVFQLSGLPFQTSSFDDARKLYEVATDDYNAVLAKYNQTLLWATPWPPAGIWSTAPIRTIDDLKTLKIRTYDSLGTVTLTEAGAAPVQLSWADVVPQLSTGGINSVLTSVEAGLSGSFPELLKYYTPIAIGTPLNIATINNDVLNSLSDEHKAAVMEAAAEVSKHQWEIVGPRVQSNFEKARAAGVTIIEDFDPALLPHLRVAGDKATATWVEQAGERGQRILADYKKSTSN